MLKWCQVCGQAFLTDDVFAIYCQHRVCRKRGVGGGGKADRRPKKQAIRQVRQ